MKIIEYDSECNACDGTGLYAGMAEKSGFAVQCSRCEGTGCASVKIEYTPFRQRKLREDVGRVLEHNPGIVVGTDKEGLTYESFGGMPYKDWDKGLPFPKGSEMRAYSCPVQWYQSCHTGGVERPEWSECGWGAFSGCEHFNNKAKCWDKFDKEQEAL